MQINELTKEKRVLEQELEKKHKEINKLEVYNQEIE